MKLTSDQVKKVAKLANLPLSFEQEERHSEQLSKILDYIEQLNKVDTSGVPPLYNVSQKKNVLREDIVSNSLTQEESLQNSPNYKKGFFITKGIFEEK